jgi:hypothetical protein
VREKKKFKKWNSIFDIINTSCNFQQNRSKEVVMAINEEKKLIKKIIKMFEIPIFCDSQRKTALFPVSQFFFFGGGGFFPS